MRRSQRAQLRYVKRKTVTIPTDVFESSIGMPMHGAEELRDDPNPVRDADDR